MRMQLIDVASSIPGFSIVDIEPTLEDYYDLIRCDTVEMPLYHIDGFDITVICDEEGALKNGRRMSAINPYNQPLFGNLLICETARTGNGLEERGLSREAQNMLESRFGMTADSEGNTYPCIDLRPRK